MASLRTTLLALCALAAAAQASQLHVLRHPDSVQYDSAAGTMPISEFDAITGAALGVSSSDFTWDGLLVGDPFQRPKVAATVIVPGASPTLGSLVTARETFDLDVNSGFPAHPSVATLASDAFGDRATTVSVSASLKVAESHGPRDVQAGGGDHIVASLGNAFIDRANSPFAVARTDVARLRAANPLKAAGVSMEGQALTLERAAGAPTLDLAQDAPMAALVEELLVMLLCTDQSRFATSIGPLVLTFTVSAFHDVADRPEASVLVAAFTDTMQQRLGAPALVQLLTLTEPVDPAPVYVRAARSLPETLPALGAANVSDNCQTYKYYCNLDSNGKLWNPDTSCSSDCPDGEGPSTKCECFAQGCGTDPAAVADRTPTRRVCVACASGFLLSAGDCYQDTDFPVTFHLVLWLFVFLALFILVTSYAIGYMDPGRDSVVYRMTNQRLKSH